MDLPTMNLEMTFPPTLGLQDDLLSGLQEDAANDEQEDSKEDKQSSNIVNGIETYN